MHFTEAEILDKFFKGKCIIVKDTHFHSLREGSEIFINGKKATLHKKELGKRAGRMALTISYMDDHAAFICTNKTQSNLDI